MTDNLISKPVKRQRAGAAMTEMGDNPSLVLMIGEMRGQMRELIHSVNQTAQIVTALGEKAAVTQGLAQDVQTLKVEAVADRVRITALEAQENKRSGALGLGNWAVKLLALLSTLGLGAIGAKLFGGAHP